MFLAFKDVKNTPTFLPMSHFISEIRTQQLLSSFLKKKIQHIPNLSALSSCSVCIAVPVHSPSCTTWVIVTLANINARDAMIDIFDAVPICNEKKGK